MPRCFQVRRCDLDLIRELPYGPATYDGRNKGRTDVSTRLRATPNRKILLAFTGASTDGHVGNTLALSKRSVTSTAVSDVLVLERASQSLDEHVDHPAAAAVHQDANAGRHERADEGSAGELAALIDVEDLQPPEARAPPAGHRGRTRCLSRSTAARPLPPGSPGP